MRVAEASEVEPFLDTPSRSIAEPAAKLGIDEEPRDCLGERGLVSGRNEEARASVNDQLRESAYVGRHDR